MNVTTVKAAHITELRTAVNAVRSLAGLAAAQWTNQTLTTTVTVISADDVRDLRLRLDEALTSLGIQNSPYEDSNLAGAPNGTLIKKTHITQLRQRATSGSGTQGSGGGGGVMYVPSDAQGSSRAVMNNNGAGTSSIIARHDYLPFGEEIGSGIGLRTGGQGFGASDNNRMKYGLTERDSITGLDHTWFRKYESLSGRWTSPDPLGGNLEDPQSLNRYTYVQNDPLNFVDPTGLRMSMICESHFDRREGGWTDLCRWFASQSEPMIPSERSPGFARGPRPIRHIPLVDKEVQKRVAAERKKNLEACINDAKKKYKEEAAALPYYGWKSMLPTTEDLGIEAVAGGISGGISLYNGATLGVAGATAGRGFVIMAVATVLYKGTRDTIKMGLAHDEVRNREYARIKECRKKFGA